MNSTNSKNEHRVFPRLMGSAFELIAVHEKAEIAKQFLTKGINEIKRIETLLSEFIPTSATSTINQNAGIQPVKVNQEVFDLLTRSQHLSKLTQGAFDITVGPLKKIYHFKQSNFQPPIDGLIQNTLNQVGHQHLILDSKAKTAFLAKPNMHAMPLIVSK